ncbi:MAG: hypothetical protein GKS05_09015 [Nitrospirales bacterium]|nr:hypothetical protein [Nitrospirales bacterium]
MSSRDDIRPRYGIGLKHGTGYKHGFGDSDPYYADVCTLSNAYCVEAGQATSPSTESGASTSPTVETATTPTYTDETTC